MEKIKPSILPGFMELLPGDQILFNSMLDSIRNTFEKFGFIPIDTPVIEKSEILLAKGGGETEKQIYRFMKGDTDLSLRFDLTVPVARYVAQHFSSLTFPFRRYHIGKVYRGEKAQKGRFREFYQCDIDIIGNQKLSVVSDAEIPAVIYSTFKELGFEAFTIRINNRKVLNGFFEGLGIKDKADVLRIIDKIDKVGKETVIKELTELGINSEVTNKIIEFIEIRGSNEEIVNKLQNLPIDNPQFIEGVDELFQVVNYMKSFNVPEANCQVELKIARGLDYYTGTIYETVLDDYPDIGSVCSGGRYDNLAEYYTNQKLPGVGISIGLTRLFYQLREANIIKPIASTLTQVLVIPTDNTMEYAIKTASKLRKQGIVSEVYLEKAKMGKKLTYANKLGIKYIIIVGEEEVEKEQLTFKDMDTGEQQNHTIEEIIFKIKE